jgi:hypothetical protein
MKYLVLQAFDTDQTNGSEVDRFAVELDKVPVCELAAEVQAFRLAFALERTGSLKPALVQFDWCEGAWLYTSPEDDEEPEESILDTLPEGVERRIAGGFLQLWWECGKPSIEFHAYTNEGLEYYSAAVGLDWLAEQAAVKS